MKRVMLVLCLFALSGCNVTDMVDSRVLAQVQTYWPAAEVSHPAVDVLLIETHMSGISAEFANKTFHEILKESGAQMRSAFPLAGYKALIVGFEGYHVFWMVEQPRFYTLNHDQYVRTYYNAFHTLPAVE